jgi:inosine/xanthosine triphosphate pyrophosphatase family protein
MPRGHAITFAELGPAEKSALGHRGQAVRAFLGHVEKSTKA